MHSKLRRLQKEEIKYMEKLYKKYAFLFFLLTTVGFLVATSFTNNYSTSNTYSSVGILYFAFVSYYFVCSAIVEGRWIVLVSGDYRFLLYASTFLGESSLSTKRNMSLILLIGITILYYQFYVRDHVSEFCNIKAREIQSKYGCSLEIISK